jgi:hypothetical protein
MKKLIAVVVLAMLATPAMANPWYAKGTFNGWGNGNQMTWDGVDNRFEATVPAGTPGQPLEFKVANADWSISYPPSNVFTYWPVDSFFDIFYYPGQTLDGWSPEWDRVGYEDSFGPWQVLGSFNGWSPVGMTNAGNGLYYADVVVPSAGVWEFKFRQPGVNGQWWSNIGIHFGENAPNCTFESWAGPETHRIELDLPHGRYRSYYIPEPATLALLLIGGLAILRRK